MQHCVSALEKMTSEQGRMMTEVNVEITAMKIEINTIKDNFLGIKELLGDLKGRKITGGKLSA